MASVLQSFVTLWFVAGFPVALVGGALIAFSVGPVVGVPAVAVTAAWLAQSLRTTCCRCPCYGTTRCGLPGMAAPLLVRRRPAASLPIARVRGHRRLDFLMLAFGCAIYCFEPRWLPAMLIWSASVVVNAFGPKPIHGLQFRLREPAAGISVRIPLPMFRAAAGPGPGSAAGSVRV